MKEELMGATGSVLVLLKTFSMIVGPALAAAVLITAVVAWIVL